MGLSHYHATIPHYMPYAVWIRDGSSYQQELDVSEEQALMFRTVSLCPYPPTCPWFTGALLSISVQKKNTLWLGFISLPNTFPLIVWLHTAAAACHWCGWLNNFGLKITSIITTAYAQALQPITAADNLLLNLLLATEIMFTTKHWK